ncbi:MAG: polymer-forming cytoskeletal protein [Candidatus Aminicenantales bacterium]
MKHRFFSIFLALFLAGTLLPLCGDEKISLKEDIFVAKDEVQDNIISFSGHVTVEGRIKENIIVFGGSLTLSGDVGDSVVGIGTAITLKSTAVVKGDVASFGGTLEKEPGCVIEGDTVYFKGGKDLSRLLSGGILTFPLMPLFLIIKLIGFFVWLLIALVAVAIFPRQLALASAQIRTAFWPVAATGLIAIILFSGLVIVFAFLSLVLIGIPFLLILAAFGLVVKIFGQVALFLFFGESLGRSFNRRAPTPIAAVVIGLLVVSLIKFIPILGFLFSFILSIVGWGVAIRTKFGTTENWLKRNV